MLVAMSVSSKVHNHEVWWHVEASLKVGGGTSAGTNIITHGEMYAPSGMPTWARFGLRAEGLLGMIWHGAGRFKITQKNRRDSHLAYSHCFSVFLKPKTFN